MEPIIIIKEKNKDGKFELTEKELKELIEQAYEQGVEDGKAQYKPNLNSWHTRDITPCYDTPVTCGTSGQPNPTTKLNGSAISTGV